MATNAITGLTDEEEARRRQLAQQRANAVFGGAAKTAASFLDPTDPLNYLGMFGKTGKALFALTAGMRPQEAQAAKVWHGSPHKFNAFDASKIGSGEGAQAFGYGVYTAESKGIAKGYRDQLSDVGKFISDEASKYGLNLNPAVQFELKTLMDTSLADITVAKMIHNRYPHMRGTNIQDLAKSIEKTRKEGKGFLYEADLPDEQIAKMLDWDAPIKEQSEAIQKLAKQFGITSPNASGKDLVAASGAQRKEGAEKLRQAGIPGIKYFDANSRSPGGKETRNFVAFPGEEKAITILERNGKTINSLLSPDPFPSTIK
jgi:hypothetical protein